MAAGGRCSSRRVPTQASRYNTGRETFLLPVTWKDGWPVILEQGKPIPYVVKGPRAMARASGPSVTRCLAISPSVDEFNSSLGPEWLQVHVPKQSRFEFMGGALRVTAAAGEPG